MVPIMKNRHCDREERAGGNLSIAASVPVNSLLRRIPPGVVTLLAMTFFIFSPVAGFFGLTPSYPMSRLHRCVPDCLCENCTVWIVFSSQRSTVLITLPLIVEPVRSMAGEMWRM
ncbi:MAG: hypothetical protein KJ607_12475 [Bacteroidetes bacterium]|nr:hypothetical protein [Bacteroidota bacterium]